MSGRASLRHIGIGALLSVAAFAAGCSAASQQDAVVKTGDLHLTYAMPQADGEEIPYRVYLPTYWTADREWPLLMILHGYSSTADSVFTDTAGKLQQEAEKYGIVVVVPTGYNGMADYGANLPLPSVLTRPGDPAKMKPEEESALAEADVLNVLERAETDYNIDPQRIYLMGNSMGMTGVLHFAAMMPEKWCAISPSGGPPWPDYPVERIAGIPAALFVHGGKDERANPEDTRKLAERAKAAGMTAQMHLVPEGTHGGAWVDYLSETMKFLAETDCTRASGPAASS